MTPLVLLAVPLLVVAGILYWLLVTTEGAYLGPRAVAFLYDWGAGSYDRVKQFDAVDDATALALPLVRALRGVRKPLILDVATGTGRLPLALLRNLEFEGSIVGLDISHRMLEEASRKAARYRDRVTWLWKDGHTLPFRDGSFHAVSCLEAVEFLASPVHAVEEMVRVLKPGGTLLLSNRIGLDAVLMPGRAFSRERLSSILERFSLVSVEIVKWQTYYDLVWARREGCLSPEEGPKTAEELLRCPSCSELALSRQSRGLACGGCGALYEIKDGVICLEKALEAGRW